MSANLHADIVGRDADLTDIGEILDRVCRLPAAVLVEGEAGIEAVSADAVGEASRRARLPYLRIVEAVGC